MKPHISALIVDDEALDRELLNNLIGSYCPSIRVVGQASNAAEATNLIKSLSPDVLFLDINMPNTNGFALLQQLDDNHQFLLVFTTGYDAYGIQAVKAGAFDYLLKPIDLDELQACEKRIAQALHKDDEDKIVSLFHNGEHHLIKVADILYLEAQGSYTQLNLLSGKQLLITKNLSTISEEIKSPDFIRVHRSFVVNSQHILTYQWQGNEGLISLTNNKQIKIGRKFKSSLKKIL
ncbi:MAG: DNA-binding response regulator [Cytophagia bacterium]|nr:DNA-binding response regulator [Cytophagia bacterium]